MYASNQAPIRKTALETNKQLGDQTQFMVKRNSYGGGKMKITNKLAE